jgi:hypothetical protein
MFIVRLLKTHLTVYKTSVCDVTKVSKNVRKVSKTSKNAVFSFFSMNNFVFMADKSNVYCPAGKDAAKHESNRLMSELKII